MKEGKTCKICAKTFTRRNYLQKHIENIHSKRYSCPTCSRYFAGPTEHSCATKDGRFVCYVNKCSLRFANGMSLRLHIRDGHRKVDENIATGAALKTKKAARDMVKMLCKKINVLSRCFDELKYQMENMTDFLTSMGYEVPLKGMPKKSPRDVVSIENYDDMDDYIDYIEEEELIEEVTEDEMIVDGSEEIVTETTNIETGNIQTITLYPKTEIKTATSSITETSKKFTPQKTHAFAARNNMERQLPVTDLPAVSRVGSTIIRQIPLKARPIQLHSIKPIVRKSARAKLQKEATTTAAPEEKDTPPLFLKIQYDTETEVCKTDPKITFHFDTRPLDNDEDELIVPT